MKIEKLPSGNYRVRKMYKGKTYTLVFEYKPTQKEIMMAMSEELENERIRSANMTFKIAAESYIDLKRNILSPSTIREYTRTIERLSPSFTDIRLSDITAIDVQKEINTLSKDRGPKTVRNYHGFISAVLGTYRPTLVLHTTLPQKVKKTPYIPSDDDVKLIISEVEDTPFEIAVLLGCYGLRRSEICALTLDDLKEDNTLTINKAMVMDKNKKWVIKTTKTEESTRDVVISPVLADKIRKQGFIYRGHPGSISKHLRALQRKHNMSQFPLHKLRHYFASKMSELGVPEEDILKMGGWKTAHVMETVYRHSLQTKDAQKRASEKFSNSLFE